MSAPDPAVIQFNTSSRFYCPPGCTPWEIRNKYPSEPQVPVGELEWYGIDFKADPKGFLATAKKYVLECIKFNFPVQDIEKNHWYHAPWLHYGKTGREPVNGLDYGLAMQLSSTLQRKVQLWGNIFYNDHAATTLHGMWQDPAKPSWEDHIKFPDVSFIILLIFADAAAEEIPVLKGVPEVKACIAESIDDPGVRNKFASSLRLIQVEFRARTKYTDSGVHWVFGTFGCDGSCIPDGTPPEDRWDQCLVPLGLQWGNDPGVKNPEDIKESWWSGEGPGFIAHHFPFEGVPESDKGWRGRLAGPTDLGRFMTACASCHSVAQLTPGYPFRNSTPFTPAPQPVLVGQEWVQQFDGVDTTWFRNLKPGEAFDKDSKSSDFNHSLHFGFTNYQHWRATQENQASSDLPPLSDVLRGRYGF